MAQKPIQPNKLYKIISSAKGPSGSSVGRKCITVEMDPRPPHSLWGKMWLVESADGKPFDFIHEETHGGDQTFQKSEGRRMRCIVAEDWLSEEDEDPPEALMREKEKELTD
jgi:hypothetical protein